MSELAFDLQWAAAPGGVKQLEDHTFALLRVLVQGKSVLTVLDKSANSTRDWLFVPVYPLAEWVSANWWRLTEEPETPQRGIGHGEYLVCHSLRSVGAGFAFPDLRVIPEGDAIRVEWHPLHTEFQNVDFLSSGGARLPRAEVEQGLDDLVRSVLSRLDACQAPQTPIHQEWAAILNGPPDEREFCRAAGWLGTDPYEADDGAVQRLLDVAANVPLSLREDLFQASTVASLGAAADWVRQGMAQISASTAQDGKWAEVRQKVHATPLSSLPWEQGYELARQLRAQLGMANAVPLNVEDVLQTPFHVLAAPNPPSRSLEAIVATNAGDAACCYTAKPRPDSRRFLAARAALELIFGPSPRQPALMSPAQVDRQQRSRAFAAELLAPASLLSARLHGREIDEDQLEDLAVEFQVSTEVVRRQIQNHRLARLAFARPDER